MNAELHYATLPADLTDAQLRGAIRHKLLSGSLHESPAHGVFGAISSGGTCAACDGSIGRGKVELHSYGADRAHKGYHPKCHLMLSLVLEDLAQQ